MEPLSQGLASSLSAGLKDTLHLVPFLDIGSDSRSWCHFLEDLQGGDKFLGAQMCGESFCSMNGVGMLWGEISGYLKLSTQQSSFNLGDQHRVFST